jgi:hypothetical protein
MAVLFIPVYRLRIVNKCDECMYHKVQNESEPRIPLEALRPSPQFTPLGEIQYLQIHIVPEIEEFPEAHYVPRRKKIPHI